MKWTTHWQKRRLMVLSNQTCSPYREPCRYKGEPHRQTLHLSQSGAASQGIHSSELGEIFKMILDASDESVLDSHVTAIFINKVEVLLVLMICIFSILFILLILSIIM